MRGVFIGAPEVVPYPTDFRRWTSMSHMWTGHNGDTWDLTTRASGVLLKAGTRGMGMPDITHFWNEGPAVDGASWNGSLISKREVFWPVSVFNKSSSQDWIQHDRRLWETWQPDLTGVWSVTQPGVDNEPGETRSLTLRLKDDGGYAPDTDPGLIGWASYALTFIAEQPYWVGDTVPLSFGQDTGPVNFYGGGAASGHGYGPPFVIGSGSSLARASIDNPGDVPGWPVWTIYGPFAGATVGVQDKTIEVPFGLPAGGSLQIDTSPAAQTAIDQDGNDRTADLGAVAFGSVPKGSTIPLTIGLAGTGHVTVAVTPRYYRAW